MYSNVQDAVHIAELLVRARLPFSCVLGLSSLLSVVWWTGVGLGCVRGACIGKACVHTFMFRALCQPARPASLVWTWRMRHLAALSI